MEFWGEKNGWQLNPPSQVCVPTAPFCLQLARRDRIFPSQVGPWTGNAIRRSGACSGLSCFRLLGMSATCAFSLSVRLWLRLRVIWQMDPGSTSNSRGVAAWLDCFKKVRGSGRKRKLPRPCNPGPRIRFFFGACRKWSLRGTSLSLEEVAAEAEASKTHAVAIDPCEKSPARSKKGNRPLLRRDILACFFSWFSPSLCDGFSHVGQAAVAFVPLSPLGQALAGAPLLHLVRLSIAFSLLPSVASLSFDRARRPMSTAARLSLSGAGLLAGHHRNRNHNLR